MLKNYDRQWLRPDVLAGLTTAAVVVPMVIYALLGSSRVRGEHALRVAKQLWWYSKVRHRGLAKSPDRMYQGSGAYQSRA